MKDTLKNTSETLNGKLDTLGETNRLIAKNILKATQMQIESSQNSNKALEKIGMELSAELRAIKESISAGMTELGSITSEINTFKETIEGSFDQSNDALEKLTLGITNIEDEMRQGSQELKLILGSLTPTLDSSLDSIHGAIMAVEEEIDDGNINNEVQKLALENIASKIELLNSDGFKNLKEGLATVENEIKIGLSSLGSLSEESLELLATEIRKAFITFHNFHNMNIIALLKLLLNG